ncbi:hypothetical protein ACOME3_010472 [Neoechinorhynchus agilis]
MSTFVPPADYPQFIVSLQDSVYCQVSYMDNPQNIYLLPNLIFKNRLDLEIGLRNVYESLRFNQFLVYGLNSKCIGKSLVDGKWYRGQITEVNILTSSFKVFYIDYGHQEWLPLVNLRPVKRIFNSIPRLALPCKLKLENQHGNSVFVNQNHSQVPEAAFEGNVFCDFIRKDEDGKYLINIEIIYKLVHFCNIENIFITQFVQEWRTYLNRELINSNGRHAEEVSRELYPGHYCLVKDSDKSFKRVKILEDQGHRFLVEEVDSGKIRFVSKLICYVASPSILAIRKTIFKCHLDGCSTKEMAQGPLEYRFRQMDTRFAQKERLIAKIIGYDVSRQSFMVKLSIKKSYGLKPLEKSLSHLLVFDKSNEESVDTTNEQNGEDANTMDDSQLNN